MFEIFKTKKNMSVCYRIYNSIVTQSRHSYFYINHGVPDTPDGRFDMITIHVFLVIRKLKNEHNKNYEMAQEIFDIMFADMEQNLREMGSGDVGVSMKIKAMVEAFYGRIKVYEAGFKNILLLENALNRNLFRKTNPNKFQVKSMAEYIQHEALRLEKVEIKDILKGNISFSIPSEILIKKNDG